MFRNIFNLTPGISDELDIKQTSDFILKNQYKYLEFELQINNIVFEHIIGEVIFQALNSVSHS